MDLMQTKHFIKYIVCSFLFLQIIGCKKTNWTENYREKEKSPFGTFIIKNEANILFEGEDFVFLNTHIYDYLFENYETTSTDFGNYILIKRNAIKLNEESIRDVLSFVADGNNAFLSLNYFSDELQKSLEFTSNNLDKNVLSIATLKERKGTFKIKDATKNEVSFYFDRNIKRHYFITYNDTTTTVLGTHKIGEEELPNFLKIQYGKGAVFVHTNPVVFTNYFLLKDTYSYTEQVFSYLPSSTILWDPHTANSKYLRNIEEDKGYVFSFFLRHQSLTWFLFTTLIGLFLFLFFNAKRKQRAIPVIPKPENTTVAFTQTISSLYLKEQNHKNLVDKKITYFLEKVRTKYLLQTHNLNQEFIEKLALKSDNDFSKTKYLVNTIINLNKKHECSEEELLVLHKMIDNFFKNKRNGDTK